MTTLDLLPDEARVPTGVLVQSRHPERRQSGRRQRLQSEMHVQLELAKGVIRRDRLHRSRRRDDRDTEIGAPPPQVAERGARGSPAPARPQTR